METILSKIIDDVPNEVLVKDIAKYFVPEKIVEALQEMIGNASNIFINESDNDNKNGKEKEKTDL